MEDFVLTDMGTHILDIARFYFGEAQSVYCQNQRVHPDVKGEDVATVMMMMGGHTTVTSNWDIRKITLNMSISLKP